MQHTIVTTWHSLFHWKSTQSDSKWSHINYLKSLLSTNKVCSIDQYPYSAFECRCPICFDWVCEKSVQPRRLLETYRLFFSLRVTCTADTCLSAGYVWMPCTVLSELVRWEGAARAAQHASLLTPPLWDFHGGWLPIPKTIMFLE